MEKPAKARKNLLMPAASPLPIVASRSLCSEASPRQVHRLHGASARQRVQLPQHLTEAGTLRGILRPTRLGGVRGGSCRAAGGVESWLSGDWLVKLTW